PQDCDDDTGKICKQQGGGAACAVDTSGNGQFGDECATDDDCGSPFTCATAAGVCAQACDGGTGFSADEICADTGAGSFCIPSADTGGVCAADAQCTTTGDVCVPAITAQDN